MAYFGSFDKAQRDQLWGSPSLRALAAAGPQPERRFEQQYALLQQRLNAALPDTLLMEHDARQRAESYLFPQEFAALRPLLSQYRAGVRHLQF
ncbi:type VI secretion system protein [Serratia ureilytica]